MLILGNEAKKFKERPDLEKKVRKCILYTLQAFELAKFLTEMLPGWSKTKPFSPSAKDTKVIMLGVSLDMLPWKIN